MASSEEALFPPVADEQGLIDIDQAMNLSEANNNNVSKHQKPRAKPSKKNDNGTGERNDNGKVERNDNGKGERNENDSGTGERRQEESESVPSESKRSKRSDHVKNTDPTSFDTTSSDTTVLTASSDTTVLDSGNGQSAEDDTREDNGQDSIDGTNGAGGESLSDCSEGGPGEGEERSGQGDRDQEEGREIQGDTGKDKSTLNRSHNTIQCYRHFFILSPFFLGTFSSPSSSSNSPSLFS